MHSGTPVVSRWVRQICISDAMLRDCVISFKRNINDSHTFRLVLISTPLDIYAQDNDDHLRLYCRKLLIRPTMEQLLLILCCLIPAGI